MTTFLKRIARRARHRPRAGDDRQLQMERDRGRAQMRVGQADRQFDQHEGRRGAVPRARAQVPRLRRRGRGDGVRRESARPTRAAAQGRDLRARLQAARRRRDRAHDIIFDPNIFAVATGIDEHRRYALDFIEAAREIRAPLPRRPHLRRPLEPQLLVPRQRAGAPRDAQRVPLPRDPGGHGHGHRQRRPARRL